MIKNFPDAIDALRLKDFEFGSIEASTDTPLERCFCKTVPIEEFLTDRYNILLGAKGAGKSSVFSLLDSARFWPGLVASWLTGFPFHSHLTQLR